MGQSKKRQTHIANLTRNRRRISDPTYVDNYPNTSDDVDVNMNRIETFTIINETYTSTKKSSTFYAGGSIRTQQRRARGLKIAAVGSSKITGFFGSVEEALRNPDLDNDTKSRSTAIGMYLEI
ncbi:2488_t:CDS:2 [Entrophospora sp. SA101]|nr:2488_t:CDS:2 [Entrophospora sp. SA101]